MAQVQELRPATPATHADAYASLIVHAEPGPQGSQRVQIAAKLARDLGARLIGLGAEALEPIPPADPLMGYAYGDWLTLMQKQVAQNLKKAESIFRRDASTAGVEWRSVKDYPAKALAREARAADLVVVSTKGPGGVGRTVDPADVIMTAGRPVLLVPPHNGHLRAQSIVVAWKDTREARRAVADAMPLLRRAEAVIVQAVCEDDASDASAHQARDVAAYLKRHGVRALAQVSADAGTKDVVSELRKVAEANGADLIVAGAFGHSRMREWWFGGVTEALIHRPPCFVLFSH